MAYTLNRPVAFAGTADEARVNHDTHAFWYDEDGGRCLHCDCRPSHTAADYPCGADVPRETVSVG